MDRVYAGEMKLRAQKIDMALSQIKDIDRYKNEQTLRDLPYLLDEGELPRLVTMGSYDSMGGILIATERRLLFAGTKGSKRAEFVYSNITSIEGRVGFLLGKLTIYVQSAKVEINNIPKEQVPRLRDHIAARLEAETISAPSDDSIYIADELEKLAELRDRGILTNSEFTSQKAKLLARV